ncbi:DUF262 domain-containing protein [Enterococcus sp. C1(2024)]|uniref:DUF262 domain-containing protein n=1 Tax=Enterococcus TaxID=1350 RepID=UPI000330E7DA|nr:DUF262 domain-containing protein [Enterococcus faecalis]EGO8298536.1 DUF262 domain-containing protein [Enterococcus faecalis]EKF8793841.1 DUF262 domain-containing protein [Enterococcus faecalis]EOF36345.1 hypothetical protein SCK_00531 [Enterococcus faecalis EnGen0103]EOF37005.1 hypothetical protein SCG_00531 [Enterococcus faecalis EnGen0102]EOF43512.1 hypothetical protein SCM_00523 [Enterococcus faecalis EnGen0104]
MVERGFQPLITIKEAIENIDKNIYLLPAIQRKFVWSPEQIESLFDSIMRKYPINSLMLWQITSDEIKNNYRFYSFLRKYKQRFGEMNEYYNSMGRTDNFFAVIDGQQRLNSLYIGLKGSYAVKLNHKRWVDNEDNFPPMKLYLNIKNTYKQETKIDKEYEFKFLRRDKVEKENKLGEKYWFEVGSILGLSDEKNRCSYLEKVGLENNEYSKDILNLLYETINEEKVLNYYLEDEQNLDKVLDIFIRTNDGGTKLTFSDLLMSFLTVHWSDARENFEELIREVNQFGDFSITIDFILKNMLVLYADDIKSRVKNFNEDVINKIKTNWERIRKSILNAFEMFYRLGFENRTFPAKNAAIPIVYYIYENKLEDEVIKNRFLDSNTQNANSQLMKKWLLLVFLKRIFGGQSDSILREIRKIIDDSSSGVFPLKEIINSAKSNPTKNYSFDDAIIEGLFEVQCGSDDAFFVLSLFYPDLDYFNQNFDIDHIHPKSKFQNKTFMENHFSKEEIDRIGNNWNKIGNLQLLNKEKNILKKDKSLSEWMEINHLNNSFLFIDEDIKLDIENFELFYENRVAKMKQDLKELVK